MASGNISNALIAGKMIAQGVGLSSADVSYVSDYLSEAAAVSDDWITAMRCSANRSMARFPRRPQTGGFTVSWTGSFQVPNR